MEHLKTNDALLLADIQNDFLPGGALGIKDGNEILPVLTRYLDRFHNRGLPIYLTRDWHPPNHCSFRTHGGPWPTHCVAGSRGSLAPPGFVAPETAVFIYKAIDPTEEAYSAFQHTSLDRFLQALGVSRLFVGGLATDYCVLNTVKDARSLGYDVCLLMDGIRAVNFHPADGHRAEQEMIDLGALPIRWETLAA